MKTIETKMTVSELREALKASRAKVRLHFTAKGNPAWQCFYRYGKNDREIGTYRLTKKEANEYLAEFGLTANLVVEIEKAIDEAQAAKTAAMKESGELYTGGRDCHKLTADEINAVYAKFAKAEADEVKTVKVKTPAIKPQIGGIEINATAKVDDTELWATRNKWAAKVDKLYAIEELIPADEFNAQLDEIHQALKTIDEQIDALHEKKAAN